jgi:predicted RNase H-like HicB family nuclease
VIARTESIDILRSRRTEPAPTLTQNRQDIAVLFGSIRQMGRQTFHLIIEKDEDGWFVGAVPELPGCHSQGRTLMELRARMKEAIRLYLGVPLPSRASPVFVEVQTIVV